MNRFAFAFVPFLASCSFIHAGEKCDPNSNGMPACSEENVGEVFRNFWDSTRYWECVEKNAEPVVILCDPGTLFDGESKQCVSWTEWTWTSPRLELIK